MADYQVTCDYLPDYAQEDERNEDDAYELVRQDEIEEKMSDLKTQLEQSIELRKAENEHREAAEELDRAMAAYNKAFENLKVTRRRLLELSK